MNDKLPIVQITLIPRTSNVRVRASNEGMLADLKYLLSVEFVVPLGTHKIGDMVTVTVA